MTCCEIRERLPLLAYGDLAEAEKKTAEAHLAGCASCREEYAALGRVRELLDAPRGPAAQVDVGAIYRQAAETQRRRARRWRRWALAGMAVAAALFIALAVWNLEIRFEGHQMVVRWGAPAEAPAPAPPQIIVREKIAPAEVTTADLQLVKDLLYAVMADMDARDTRHKEGLAVVRVRLDLMQRQALDRWTATQRLVSLLHTAQLQKE